MSEVKINFEWSRAYSTRSGQAAYAIDNGKIRQIGERKQSYSPLKLGALSSEFSGLDGSPEQCLGFAEKYGLLTERARTTKLPEEDLAFWRYEIRRMASNTRRWPQSVRFAHSVGTFVKVCKIEIFLIPGEGIDARPVMVMQPASLLDAMNLEMANFISAGGTLIPCRGCGVMFQAGRAGGKRLVAQFHNNECRIAFNNAKRRGK